VISRRNSRQGSGAFDNEFSPTHHYAHGPTQCYAALQHSLKTMVWHGICSTASSTSGIRGTAHHNTAKRLSKTPKRGVRTKKMHLGFPVSMGYCFAPKNYFPWCFPWDIQTPFHARVNLCGYTGRAGHWKIQRLPFKGRRPGAGGMRASPVDKARPLGGKDRRCTPHRLPCNFR